MILLSGRWWCQGSGREDTYGECGATFRGKQVLEAVTFGYMHFRVKVYVLRPIRCWRYQMFGHVEARCQVAMVSYVWGRTQDHGG